MKIALFEDLGVAQDIIEKHKKKLLDLGHTFIQFEKNQDIDVLIERISGVDVLMLANMKIDQKVIEKADSLKYINIAFTGVDHIPLDYAKSRNIDISNASGYSTDSVAELCICFMLQLLRNVGKVEERCRNSLTKDGLIGSTLKGKTVGIIGGGKIGSQVAKLAKLFGAKTVLYSRSKKDSNLFDEQLDLEKLLAVSDIVSLHCPLTKETENLISYNQFSKMKSTAFLINTARGNVINQEALSDALKNGVISGAAIDVFDIEPPLPSNHILLNTPNLILTPHIAFATKESLQLRAEIVFDNLYSWLNGEVKNRI